MEKKESVKDTLVDLEIMSKASKKRQKGKNVTSEDIKARMQKRETDKAKEEAKAAKKEAKAAKKEARKAGRPFSTPQYVAPNGKEYAGPGYGPKPERKAKEEKPKKAPRRRATGRSEMMSERQRAVMGREEEKRKQAQEKGGSSVVGS
jgi:hypothetical protein